MDVKKEVETSSSATIQDDIKVILIESGQTTDNILYQSTEALPSIPWHAASWLSGLPIGQHAPYMDIGDER